MNANPMGADSELDQPALQPAGYRNQTIRLLRCPADPPARHNVLRNYVQIASANATTGVVTFNDPVMFTHKIT